MKKFLSLLFSRMVVVGFLILLQILVLLLWIWQFSEYSEYFYITLILFSAVVALRVISGNDNPSYKIAWLIPILLFPVFGGFLYILFGSQRLTREFRRKLRSITDETAHFLEKDDEAALALSVVDPSAGLQSRYITENSSFPLWQNTTVKYYPLGEDKFEDLCLELEKAEHFIFL